MKILITGDKGFIGSHLVKVLDQFHDVVGADLKSKTDIRSQTFLFKACRFKPDLIIHLAATCSTAKSIQNPWGDFQMNAMGTLQICELARITGAKVLYTSTCKVHPNNEGARAPYGLSKYVGELYLQEYGHMYGVDWIINRPGTIYGPGQVASSESGWLSWFVQAFKDNLILTIYGDGKQTRDVLWVEDYVNLLNDQINNWDKYRGKIYEVGGGKENEISLLQAVEFLEKKFGKTPMKFTEPRKGDIKHFCSDNKLVSSINGWKPTVSWRMGIKRLTI